MFSLPGYAWADGPLSGAAPTSTCCKPADIQSVGGTALHECTKCGKAWRRGELSPSRAPTSLTAQS